MATLVLRGSKGSPLTHAEVDANFTNLNTDVTTLDSAALKKAGDTATGAITFTGGLACNSQYKANITAVAALNIDCSLGNYFTKTISGDSTFTVSNVPASTAYAFTLELTHTSGIITWFSGVEWSGGTAPSLTTGKTHLFTFVTDDGGSRWRGVANPNYTT